MVDRRHFLGALCVPGMLAAPALRRASAAEAIASITARPSRSPEEDAQDEDLWFTVQQGYALDRSLVNLNNGGVSPAPTLVMEAMKRHLDHSNHLPAKNMWHVLERQKESVRTNLARAFGCDRDELAITRNASEGLQILQFGFDLAPGDQVLFTNQDYPRMRQTFRQRARREGIEAVEIQGVPTPCEDPEQLVRLYGSHITDCTRLILVSQVVNLTGQIQDVRGVCELGRARDIPVLVDGAHAFGHFPFTRDELGCDYYATSLHKWLSGPIGTGFLYVRKDLIGGVWSLQPALETLDEDIRKFEEIGTHPAANFLAIAEAQLFHEAIGIERKAARLRYLKERWARRIENHERVRLHTSLDPRFSGGIATVQVEGVDTRKLAGHLWAKHKIATVGIVHDEFEGLRVSPHVYTTLAEIDRFSEVLDVVIRDGLPS